MVCLLCVLYFAFVFFHLALSVERVLIRILSIVSLWLVDSEKGGQIPLLVTADSKRKINMYSGSTMAKVVRYH